MVKELRDLLSFIQRLSTAHTMSVMTRNWCLLSMLIVAGLLHAQSLPRLTIPASSDTFNSNRDVNPIAAFEDVIIAASLVEKVVYIMHKNASGGFETRAVVNTAEFCTSVQTNGRWYACSPMSAAAETFQLDGDYQPIKRTNLAGEGRFILRFLPDDTAVLVDIRGITSYTHDGTDWMMDNTHSADYLGYVENSSAFLNDQGDILITVGNDQHSELFIHERNNLDKTWRLKEIINATWDNIGYMPAWNGDDVVALGYYEAGFNPYGEVHFFTKMNGEWILPPQTLKASEVDSTGDVYLGYYIGFVNKDTLVMTAMGDGTVAPDYHGGSVIVAARNSSGIWEAKMKVKSTVNEEQFGLGLLPVTDGHAIASCDTTGACKFHVLNDCFYTINLECRDSDQCGAEALTGLYSIAGPECYEAPVVTVQSNTTVTGGYELTFLATQGPGPLSATCKSVVTCLAAPVAGTAPIKAPVGKTSSAAGTYLSFGMMLLSFVLA